MILTLQKARIECLFMEIATAKANATTRIGLPHTHTAQLNP